MDMACSPTWFLIVTLLAWAVVALVAVSGAPYATASEQPEGSRSDLGRRAPRRFAVRSSKGARASRGGTTRAR